MSARRDFHFPFMDPFFPLACDTCFFYRPIDIFLFSSATRDFFLLIRGWRKKRIGDGKKPENEGPARDTPVTSCLLLRVTGPSSLRLLLPSLLSSFPSFSYRRPGLFLLLSAWEKRSEKKERLAIHYSLLLPTDDCFFSLSFRSSVRQRIGRWMGGDYLFFDY